jgi:hypothetical protein
MEKAEKAVWTEDAMKIAIISTSSLSSPGKNKSVRVQFNKSIIVLLTLLAGANLVHGQEVTSSLQRKNIIKLDLASNFLYRNVVGISFERLTKPNQSFMVSANYQEFPGTLRLSSDITVQDDKKRSGYKFGGEYRFYLAKENKFMAPRGLYIGPYFASNGFNNERILEIDNDGTVEHAILDSKLTVLNIGFEMGYQFVLKNRWTIDLTFVGPSVSYYRCKLDLSGNYTFDKEDIENEIILGLLDRFPFLDEAISNKEAIKDGTFDTWAYGFRYQLQFGYHFGRK